MIRTVTSGDLSSLMPSLLAEDPIRRAPGLRLDNLGVLDREVWTRGDTAATDVIDTRPDATVLDLGGFSTPDQQPVIALSLLDELWERRESRRPVRLVIDEAHDLCSPELDSPLAVTVRERLIQIAAEGRNFGLWLLLSTQRPSKVHGGIILQCDNLAVMKVSSPLDADGLATYFDFAPPALLARSPGSRQGNALFAGDFVAAAPRCCGSVDDSRQRVAATSRPTALIREARWRVVRRPVRVLFRTPSGHGFCLHCHLAGLQDRTSP